MGLLAAVLIFSAVAAPGPAGRDQGDIAAARAAWYAGFTGWRGPALPNGATPVRKLPTGEWLFVTTRDVDAGPLAHRLDGDGPWPTGRLFARLGETIDGELLASVGVRSDGPLGVRGWWMLDAGAPEAAETARQRLRRRGIDAAHDRLVRLELRSPFDDAYYGMQWHLENTLQRPELPLMSAGADVSAVEAWSTTFGSPDVTIAVIDSGLAGDHPDFDEPGKVLAPLNTGDGSDNPRPPLGDVQGAHGQACAGLAAASRQGTTGVVGVCPDCSIMPIRILGDFGFSSDSAVADAFVHARVEGADVLTNSWGYVYEQPPAAVSEALSQLVREGRGGLGAVILFAMGNSYEEAVPYELANHPAVIGVGGTGADDTRVAYSTWGEHIDVVAPTGHDVDFDDDGNLALLGPGLVTTDIPGFDGYSPSLDEFFVAAAQFHADYTVSMSGTSGACPIAAGVVGLLLSAHPELTYGEVMWVLKESAEQVGDEPYDASGWNALYGHGRVNAALALDLAAGPICNASPEDCGDDLDNDCDGAIDALDDDCGFVLPAADVDVGAYCEEPFVSSCGEGVCFAVGDSGGWCALLCTSPDACPDDSVCIEQGEAFPDFGVCMATCNDDSDCDGQLVCTAPDDGGVCMPRCFDTFECPAAHTCVNQRCRPDGAGPGPDVEPDVEPEPQPDMEPGPAPDVEPGPQPDPSPEATTFPARRPPTRVTIAAGESSCAQTPTPVSGALLLGLLLARRRRRRGRALR